jgi:putative membrane protein
VPGDPRVYFAAERTQLAWLRTRLTVMAFGFVIARFGLFLRIVAIQLPALAERAGSGASAVLGVALVGIGTAMVIAATLQYRRLIANLPIEDRPQPHTGGTLILAGSVVIALVGVALVGYILLAAA